MEQLLEQETSARYDRSANETAIEKAVEGLKGRNFVPVVVENRAQALEAIKRIIPAGASVMNGASVTLQEIGYVEYLQSGNAPWNNLHEGILAEKDPAKQRQLRREALLSDYYLGSVHALAETGELIIASNSGSQLPHIAFSSPNVVFVVSTKKLTPTLEDARRRLREHVVPLEDARMKSVGLGGTHLNKELIFHAEPTYTGRVITVILVKEELGF